MDKHGDGLFEVQAIPESAGSKLVWFPSGGLTVRSVTAFSIPACSIRSLTFFCRSSIRLPISSSSALRRAACRDPPTLTQKPSKTLLQMTAPDQVAWHQGSGSATCETRGSRRQSGLTCRQVPAEVLRCVFILGTVGSVLRTRLLRCARGLGNVR